MADSSKPMPIAIVGISCRLPGASDVQGFWEVLSATQTSISVVPEQRWDWKDNFGAPASGPNTSYSKVGGFIEHVDRFDYSFFRISPREAAAMDPMQRLFLQATWGALEDGGFPPRSLAERKVGVFVGVGHSEYANMMREAGCDADVYRATGMAMTLVANRVSYLLNLQGPSEVIDTACSSSLVALHRAVEQLRLGHCDLAIAGGINLMLSPELHVAFSQAGMLSISGCCRPFDAGADGYVRGEGVVALVLKPLDRARQDGDFVYATIATSAENHGGRAHSLTAPNFRGQAKVITTAWNSVGAAIDRLSYVETHGTGTPLGDPVEVAGLVEAWRSVAAVRQQAANRRIILGTLKSRIGHLEAAAGVAGVLKAALALRYGLIPSNLGYEKPNPQIDLKASPFEIIDQPTIWFDDSGPKLAGVSSFGFGGVNAHVVLEEEMADTRDEGIHHPAEICAEILILSAGDKDGLLARAAQLLNYLYPGANAEVIGAVICAYLHLSGSDESAVDLDAHFEMLGFDESKLWTLLDEIGARCGVTIGWSDVRDCLCLGDLAAAISESLSADTLAGSTLVGRLAVRASLPRSYVQPTLRELATTMSLGRDLMRERFVIVSRSISELARQLAALLTGTEPVARTLLTRERRGGVTKPEPSAPGPLLADSAVADELFTLVASIADKDDLAAVLEQRYSGSFSRRIPLPSMPFRLDRAWFTKPQFGAAMSAPSSSVLQEPCLTSWPTAPLLACWFDHFGVRITAVPSLLPWPEEVAKQRSHAVQPVLKLRDLRWAPPPVEAESICLRCNPTQDSIDYQCVKGVEASTIFRAVLATSQGSVVEPAESILGSDSHAGIGREFEMADVLLRTSPPWQGCPRLMKGRLMDGVLELRRHSGSCVVDDLSLRAEWSIILVQAIQVLLSELEPRCLLLPFKAEALDMEAGISDLPERLRLSSDPLTGLISVWAWQGGRRVLHLSGLEVREAPWIFSLLTPTTAAGNTKESVSIT